jgi:hypothetical protein
LSTKRFFPEFALELLMLLIAMLPALRPSLAFCQTPASLQEEEKLEREFTDPLTTMPQVVIRDSYTPANYGPCTPVACVRDYETNQLIVRPLIPRIPPYTLLPFMQLVRPTFALVTVPSSRGGTRTEFGDLPIFDVAVLPWPDRQKPDFWSESGRPLFFPTATSKSAGVRLGREELPKTLNSAIRAKSYFVGIGLKANGRRLT